MSDIENLLDATLDDLADLPEFKPYPDGAHQVLATMEAKTIGGKPAIELSFKLVETIELSSPVEEGAEPKPGDQSNTLYFLDNEFGQGKFKKIAKVFKDALSLEGETNRVIVEQVTDIECVIVSNVTIDKKDKTKHYLNVQELQVV